MVGTELFSEELIFIEQELEDRTALFKWFNNYMFKEGYVKENYYQSILKREEQFPTGIQTTTVGVAIPHADPENLNEPFIAVIIPQKSIEFEPMGIAEGKIQAKLIFMLGVLKNGDQVIALQKLMNLLSNDEAVQQLLEVRTCKEVMAVIQKNFDQPE
ncbi:PTS sugar transporter subunit IIA [Enterococcus sp. BWB1-3]|uniref:PTS sugar transporter subunit IIA n=1 Tax=unclassified Enterococcus TaxID=2608891 RepID=UPI0019242DE2|nr:MULTISPECIES: PTS sugar transporter subunit IIA [unclassified Enterococcus]MBL1230691.1 PTS sugar transporter subunit IIA [Enterococcus sp. BWB1-3]MCB5952916.1 PTS sugar transporter subunit IIA [Enterococcus sp. BWT-B8]MCB5953576.1 PTS sugar transporter subunit IIA [Enterococcus sp. CWB-B31]